MKKLTLLLAAAVACFTASAQLYVTGEGVKGASANWNPAAPLEVTAENGVYTFQAQGDFKISNAKGTWNDFNAGAKNLDGSWNKATNTATANLKAGDDPNILAPMARTLITYEVNEGMTTIKATLPDGLTFGEEQPKDFYVIGNAFGGWTLANPTYKMTRDGNVYTYVAENGISGTWKINDGTWSVQFGSNGSAPVVGEVYDLGSGSNPADISSNIPSKATITFTYNEGAQSTLLITTEGSVSYPETIYVVGYVDGKEFLPTSTVALAKGEVEGTYEGEVNCTGALGSDFSYIQLATNTGESDTDWAGLGTRYGAPEADATITEEPSEIVAGQDMSWKLAVGTYTIKVSLVDMTICAVGGETPEEPKAFGLVGSIGNQGWDIENPLEMEADGNVFTYGLESVEKDAAFKIATIGKGWDDTFGGENEEAKAPVAIVPGEAMNAWLGSSSDFVFEKAMENVTITFTYNETAGEASTVTVTGTVVENPVDLTATFNFPEIAAGYDASAWKPENNNQMIVVSGTVFESNGATIVATKGNSTDARLYKQQSGAIQYRVYNGAKLTIAVPTGYYIETVTIYGALANSKTNLSSLACTEECANSFTSSTLSTYPSTDIKSGIEFTYVETALRDNIVLTPSKNAQITLVDVVAKQSATGVEGIGADVDENAPVEYYNLNGVRVAEPTNGIFIRRQGSNVTKIIVR